MAAFVSDALEVTRLRSLDDVAKESVDLTDSGEIAGGIEKFGSAGLVAVLRGGGLREMVHAEGFFIGRNEHATTAAAGVD